MKKQASTIVAIIILSIIASACGSKPIKITGEFSVQKFISTIDLKKFGDIPDRVFFEVGKPFFAVSWRSKSNKKRLSFYNFEKFYDVDNAAPPLYFETSYADDIFPPLFNQDGSIKYGLLNEKRWNVFEKKHSKDAATVIFSGNSLSNLYILDKISLDAMRYKAIMDVFVNARGQAVFKGFLGDDDGWVVWSVDAVNHKLVAS